MILLAESGFLTKLACESTDCLSYIISLIDILTILYLAYCASFRVNKGVRIFGWVWAALVIAATVTIIAIHTCLFTLVSALFTALIMMALFGVSLVTRISFLDSFNATAAALVIKVSASPVDILARDEELQGATIIASNL